jgi:hypothetical protein
MGVNHIMCIKNRCGENPHLSQTHKSIEDLEAAQEEPETPAENRNLRAKRDEIPSFSRKRQFAISSPTSFLGDVTLPAPILQ